MHVHFLDPYRPRPSLIHRLDPRVKFVLTLAFILTTALTPMGAWPVYVLLFSIVLSVEMLSELGVGYVLKRASLALPFALAALPVLVHGQRHADPDRAHRAMDADGHAGRRRTLCQHRSQVVAFGADGDRPRVEHVLSRLARGDAGRQDSAPAGGDCRTDVALPVRDGG